MTESSEFDELWRVQDISESDIENEWIKWKKKLYEILDKSFGKIRISNKVKPGVDKEVKELIAEKRKIRKEINKEENRPKKSELIRKRQDIEKKIAEKVEGNEERKLEKIINKLNDKANNNQVLWKLRRDINSKSQCQFVVKDKEGNELRDPEKIIQRVTEYYNEIYRNNEVVNGYEEYNRALETLIRECWKWKDTENETLSDEEVENVIKKLRMGKSAGPDKISNEMIKRSGKSFENSVIRMMKTVYENEYIPSEWHKAYIKNIYKGKGSKKDLNNYRGIILNSHLLKMMEKIIESKEIEKLEDMSDYQCGARKGKSVREHHFVIRNVIEEAKVKKEEITAVYFDISKCFDKMVLKEVMKELWLKGIRGKNWRIIYNINSENVLIPKTEIGECMEIKVKEMIRQGSVLGAKISSLTIDSLSRMMKAREN